MGEIVTFPSNGHQASGYLAKPASGGPGLIVIQEWWGLNDNIKSIADRFAQAGFVALAPDLYHGQVATAPDDAKRLSMELQLEQAAKDMSGAVDFILQHTSSKAVGVLGFCLGGGMALALAAQRPDAIKAAAPFYGLPRYTNLNWAGLTAKVQGHYAALDQRITPELAKNLEAQLKDLGKEVEMLIYEGADHAFFNDSSRAYHPEAATQAWERVITFLKETLDTK
jgi:carboxymethylenebutenolidase